MASLSIEYSGLAGVQTRRFEKIVNNNYYTLTINQIHILLIGLRR